MTLLRPPLSLPRACAAPTGRDLRVRVDFRPGSVQVTLSGELDLAGRELLGSVLTCLVETGPERVVVDLPGLRFADCAGAAPLVLAERSAREAGRVLELHGPCPALARLRDAAPASWPASWAGLS